MSHIAIQERLDGNAVDWIEKVRRAVLELSSRCAKSPSRETRGPLLGTITIRPKAWRDLTADWQERARRPTLGLLKHAQGNGAKPGPQQLPN
jgi:hypothetical protein